MIIVSCPLSKPPLKGAKTQNGRFPSNKIALRLKKVCYKVSLCEICQRQSCKAFIGLTIHAKMTCGGGWPLLPELLDQTDRVGLSEIADFRSLFDSSDSAVTPSEKTSINTNTKPTTRFPMSPRWTSYVVPKPSLRVAQKRKVSKIWTISYKLRNGTR